MCEHFFLGIAVLCHWTITSAMIEVEGEFADHVEDDVVEISRFFDDGDAGGVIEGSILVVDGTDANVDALLFGHLGESVDGVTEVLGDHGGIPLCGVKGLKR